MKNEREFRKEVARRPHHHVRAGQGEYLARRGFFQLAGAGVAGSVLSGMPAMGQVVTKLGVPLIGRASNVIFVMLGGAPSHTDLFDFKESPDTPLDVMKPETIGGVRFPTGILPKLATQLGDLCIVRSMRSWALQHTLAQVWAQIGRSPAAALGDIAPAAGAIVAVEKEPERKTGQVFPTFLALNSGGAVGSGYLPATYAPLKITPATSGLPDTTNADGQARFESKYALLASLEASLRTPANPFGATMGGYDAFYRSGRAMMFNPTVDQAFRFTATESERYGSTGFGNACLVANKVLQARGGTRFIEITLGGWDHHQNIYTALPPLARTLDNGLSTLLGDLKSSGLLGETLVVMMGEFGRTVGRLTGQQGRDHHLQQFAIAAGAGVKGGRVIGSTDATGGATVESGWSRERDIRPEDWQATILSAMGIDWTTVRYDDPFGRGFYYVPESNRDLYGPISELWG